MTDASIAELKSSIPEEVSASMEEMSAQVQELVAQALEPSQMAEQLKAAVAQFKTGDDVQVVLRRRKTDCGDQRPGGNLAQNPPL